MRSAEKKAQDEVQLAIRDLGSEDHHASMKGTPPCTFSLNQLTKTGKSLQQYSRADCCGRLVVGHASPQPKGHEGVHQCHGQPSKITGGSVRRRFCRADPYPAERGVAGDIAALRRGVDFVVINGGASVHRNSLVPRLLAWAATRKTILYLRPPPQLRPPRISS